MGLLLRKPWNLFRKKGNGRLQTVDGAQAASPVEAPPGSRAMTVEMDIASDDPLLAHLLKGSGVIEIEKLEMDSPALRVLKDAGVKISVPLISQGELIGVLNLGPRLSEQEYSTDD